MPKKSTVTPCSKYRPANIASNAAVLMTVIFLYPAPGSAAKMQAGPAQEMQKIRFVVRRRRCAAPFFVASGVHVSLLPLAPFFLPPNYRYSIPLELFLAPAPFWKRRGVMGWGEGGPPAMILHGDGR
jgi:hypothetical protein